MINEWIFFLPNESELIDIDDAAYPRPAVALNGEAFPTICCFSLYAPHWPRVINLINVCMNVRVWIYVYFYVIVVVVRL